MLTTGILLVGSPFRVQTKARTVHHLLQNARMHLARRSTWRTTNPNVPQSLDDASVWPRHGHSGRELRALGRRGCSRGACTLGASALQRGSGPLG